MSDVSRVGKKLAPKTEKELEGEIPKITTTLPRISTLFQKAF